MGLQLIEAAERGLPGQHQIRGVGSGHGKGVGHSLHGRRARCVRLQSLRNKRKDTNCSHETFCSFFLFTCGSCSLSVMVPCRKLPNLVKEASSLLKAMETEHNLSRSCFFSRQMAKAQPTAWLNRSPLKKKEGRKNQFLFLQC